MSYILDALKRADAERERGHVPGLHTRSTPELDTPAAGAGGHAQRRRLIALAGLIALGVVVVWWWPRAAPSAAPATPEAAPVAAASTAPLSPPIQPPEPAGNGRVIRENAQPVLPILAPPPPRAPAKAPASPAVQPAAEAQRALGEPASGAATREGTKAPGTDSAPAAGTTVLGFAELSPEARARLPAVKVSGSTYSKDPALRMLIVNGKVVQEGGEIGPGLTLETIEQRSAVLNHQGLRYRIGY
jgi:general secretion pathway protein B